MSADHDVQLERTVLAAIASPHRYRLRALDEIGAECFYDGRHARIVSALRADAPMIAPDHRYVDDVVAHAWPLCRGHLERLRDLADRRARFRTLVRQLNELVAA
jgi:hypothetical protein